MLHAAFLADICAAPDDDAPRLIYADWLEDNGDADRAELIRAQVRRMHLAEDAFEQRGLAGVEADLLNRHGAAWRAALPRLDGVEWGAFSRGFVWYARVRSADAFLDHADALFAAAPVRQVKLLDEVTPEAAARLAASPHLRRLTHLDVGNRALPQFRAAQALLASPHLTALRDLLMHVNPLGDDVMGLLADAHLPSLDELYLSGCGITEIGLWRVAGTGALAGLVVLDLRDDSLNDGSIPALAGWACAPTLRTLYVVNNRLGPASAADLAWRPPGLRRLYLNHNRLTESGALALAGSPLTPLRELDVRYCDIRDAGQLALAASPLASRLTKLWLQAGNPVNLSTTPGEVRRLLGPRLAG